MKKKGQNILPDSFCNCHDVTGCARGTNGETREKRICPALHLKDSKSAHHSNPCTTMHIPTLAISLNQPGCLSTGKWIYKTAVPSHNGILFTHKERKYAIFRKMDATRDIVISEISQTRQINNACFRIFADPNLYVDA